MSFVLYRFFYYITYSCKKQQLSSQSRQNFKLFSKWGVFGVQTDRIRKVLDRNLKLVDRKQKVTDKTAISTD